MTKVRMIILRYSVIHRLVFLLEHGCQWPKDVLIVSDDLPFVFLLR